jgi:hypothetical protein
MKTFYELTLEKLSAIDRQREADIVAFRKLCSIVSSDRRAGSGSTDLKIKDGVATLFYRSEPVCDFRIAKGIFEVRRATATDWTSHESEAAAIDELATVLADRVSVVHEAESAAA